MNPGDTCLWCSQPPGLTPRPGSGVPRRHHLGNPERVTGCQRCGAGWGALVTAGNAPTLTTQAGRASAFQTDAALCKGQFCQCGPFNREPLDLGKLLGCHGEGPSRKPIRLQGMGGQCPRLHRARLPHYTSPQTRGPYAPVSVLRFKQESRVATAKPSPETGFLQFRPFQAFISKLYINYIT